MKACPECAEQIQDAAVKCRHCGARFDGATPAGERDRPVRPVRRPIVPAKPPKARDHESYWTYTAACILLPIVGLILGIIQMTKSDPLDRKLGEHALAFSILMMIVWVAFTL